MPKLKHGIPDLDFPPMDPYVTEDAKLNYTLSESIVGRFSVHQVNTYGLVKGEVQNVSAHFSQNGTVMRLTIDVFFPESYVKGNYRGVARLGLLPFRSGGPFNVTITDTVITWQIHGKLLKRKDGEEFMQVRSFKFKPKVGDLKLSMEGLFASKQLTSTAVKLLNGRWKYFVRQLMPETQNYFGPELVKIVNKIFMKVPFNHLLPESERGETTPFIATTVKHIEKEKEEEGVGEVKKEEIS